MYLETIYIICFAIGFLFAIGTAIFGDVFDMDVAHDLPFLSPTIIASFLTIFGGIGLFLGALTDFSTLLIAILSIISALIGSSVMFFFVMLPLKKAEKSSAKSSTEMIGQTAEVITTIGAKTKGEIMYQQGGSRLSSPASSQHQEEIQAGSRVEIVDVIGGTFIVQKQKGE